MLIKTHLVIAISLVLIVFSAVEYKAIFLATVFIATFLPDIDHAGSSLGKRKIFRIVQLFTKHRGMLHSFTFLFLITIILVLFFKILSLGFFLGYGTHLLVDSFSIDGIQPFFPFKKTVSGFIRTGGKTELTIFVTFLLIDALLLFVKLNQFL